MFGFVVWRLGLHALRRGARQYAARRQGPGRGGTRMQAPGAVLACLLALVGVRDAWPRSPLVAEVRAFSKRYHEDLSRLDAVRRGLEEAAKQEPDLETLMALAQVSFIWGDIRATTPEQKLEAYDRGREAARRAIELDPKSPEAHFWFATNTARWGQVNGVLRSLFLLPSVKKEIQIILDLDPNFTPVYALAGNVYYEVPRLLGGDLDRAEAMFRKGLEQDPRFTGLRVGLAKTLIRKGRFAEAQQQLEAVLDEKQPRNLAEWTLKDSRRARELLGSIRDRS
jgi:tetratricopeptide (TPR) repeat protein